MELKEAIGKCEKAVKVLTGNDTGIRLDFEGTASAIDKVLEELNSRIPVKKVEQLINKIKNETWYIESGAEAKQACIEELESLLDKE